MSQRYDSEEPTPIGPCFATYDEAADYCINEAMPYVKEFGERFADNAPVWIVPGEDVRLDFSGSVLDRDTAQALFLDRASAEALIAGLEAYDAKRIRWARKFDASSPDHRLSRELQLKLHALIDQL